MTELEKGSIIAHASDGMSERAIATLLGRSRPVVHAFLTSPDTYDTTKRSGRPRTLTVYGQRRLLREAKKGKSSARELQKKLEIPLSVRRVRELLQEDPELKYTKRKGAPVLTPRHIEARLQWAFEKITWDAAKWAKVVFSDEKKFNLDGPDGLQYYWHDLRREKEIYSRRQSGGGSVMIWGAFCAEGKPDLVILEGTQDADAYVWTLSEHLLPFIDGVYGRDCIFQQDNASIHSAQTTKRFFQEQDVQVMEWPAKSPDLNPIENMWGVLARAVYASGRQFQTKADLISTIERSWAEIGQDLIDKLLKSMPNRCIEVVQNRGMMTKY